MNGSAPYNKIHNKFQAIGAICRQAGHRFGDHVERVVPLVLQYAKMEDEELREQCLQVCKEEHFQEMSKNLSLGKSNHLTIICLSINFRLAKT